MFFAVATNHSVFAHAQRICLLPISGSWFKAYSNWPVLYTFIHSTDCPFSTRLFPFHNEGYPTTAGFVRSIDNATATSIATPNHCFCTSFEPIGFEHFFNTTLFPFTLCTCNAIETATCFEQTRNRSFVLCSSSAFVDRSLHFSRFWFHFVYKFVNFFLVFKTSVIPVQINFLFFMLLFTNVVLEIINTQRVFKVITSSIANLCRHVKSISRVSIFWCFLPKLYLQSKSKKNDFFGFQSQCSKPSMVLK